MEFVAVLGSPRPSGNSASLALHLLETARASGAGVRSFSLNRLSYRGCQACNACKETSEVCVLKDDLAEVLEAVVRADVLVLATPVYYGDVSGQMKCFIDRTFSFFTPDFRTAAGHRSRLGTGKKLAFVQTQAHPDEAAFAGIFERYEYFLRFHGFEEAHAVRVCGLVAPEDVKGHPGAFRRVEEVARRLASAA